MKRRIISSIAVFTALAGAATTACGSSTTVTGCNYTFEASVKHGPSTGTRLGGAFELADANDRLFAILHDDTLGDVKAQGLVDSDQGVLEMTFQLPDDARIVGTGAVSAAMPDEGCQEATLSGGFSGPKDDDFGDWLLSQPSSS